MFSSVNGIYMADIVGNKDTHFNVDQLYNEALRSYANLDVEYTAPHETIRQEMKNDHNKYNEAVRGLEHLAANEAENSNNKSSNNTKHIMGMMYTQQNDRY